jgi:hypothetical protein
MSRRLGSKDSYLRCKDNYHGGVKGRKIKDTYAYFRRWELNRIQSSLGKPLIEIDETEIRRRYQLKMFCCGIGLVGRKYRLSIGHK